jgi:hypothetical protein
VARLKDSSGPHSAMLHAPPALPLVLAARTPSPARCSVRTIFRQPISQGPAAMLAR